MLLLTKSLENHATALGKTCCSLMVVQRNYASSRRRLAPPILPKRSLGVGSVLPDPTLVDARNAPVDFTASCAVVYRDFITPEEADVITAEVISRMKRRRYEKGHWDAVITGYKEIELQDISFPTHHGERDPMSVPEIFERIRHHLSENHIDYEPVQWLACHAIDLKKDGKLNAHVDSVRFSGDLVAGISLLSSSIMRLIPPHSSEIDGTKQDESASDHGHVDLLLPPNSLYALSGVGRYKYSHQLLPDSSIFTCPISGNETCVHRDHRLSIIFRDAKKEDHHT